MPYSWFLSAWWLILAATAVIAFWRCGAAERISVTGLVANSLASVAVLSDHGWNRLQWPLTAADAAMLGLFFAVTFLCKRLWAVAITAITVGLVSLHVVTILEWPDVWMPAYALLTILLSWLLLFTLSATIAVSAFSRHKDSDRDQ